MPFALEISPDRRSRRSPEPRFQSNFDALSGVLYHFGNSTCKLGGYFFAYALLAPGSNRANVLELAREFASAVKDFLERLPAASAVGQLLFMTDWQFGPEHALWFGPLGLDAFWREYEQRRVLLNAAYTIQKIRRGPFADASHAGLPRN